MPAAETIPTISAEQLSRLTGFTVAELNTLARNGYFPKAKDDAYEQAKALVGCFKAYQNKVKEIGTLPTYQSMAECSTQTGIPRTVLKAARKESPESFRAHRIMLGPLLKWVFSQNGDSADWGDYLKKFQALREEIKYQHDHGLVIDFAEVDRCLQKGMALLFEAIEREFSVRLPPVLKGLSETEIQQHLSQAVEGFKAILRDELAQAKGKT